MKKVLLLILGCAGMASASNIPITPGTGGNIIHTETQGGAENQVVEMVGPNGSTVTVISGNLQTTALNVVAVSSTSVPAAVADGSTRTLEGTNIGQALVTGVPWGIIQSTYSTQITTANIVGQIGIGSESVLVSSPTQGNYTYFCGCTFNNPVSSGTVILESPFSTVASRFPISLQAAPSSPQGIWPGCTNPFYRSASNSNTYIFVKNTTPANTSMVVDMRCIYYQAP